jgi:cytochrome P450
MMAITESAATLAEEKPVVSPSPCHPVELGTPIRWPSGSRLPTLGQTLRFVRRPYGAALADQRRYGDVWTMKLASRSDTFLVTSHPEHVRAVMTANPADAPSLTGESPLRPILGPNSVLTLTGERHMRQRKLLLGPFHGEAVARYVSMIEQIVASEIDSWKAGQTFALAPRMQAVTLEVIMRGVLGIEEPGPWRSPQRQFRERVRFFLRSSTNPLYQAVELRNSARHEPRGVLRGMVAAINRPLYALIRQRRAEGVVEGRHDVFSMLLAARDEEGEPLSDEELRDELLTLILAGHETTANSLAWTFERLVRSPAAYDRLREIVRGNDEEAASAYVEATIHEGMRARPVIGFVVRMVQRPWRFGEYVVPARTPVALSIIALHHREDLYPCPDAFRPERFLDQAGHFAKPGTYEWIPFGGGIRRCLGATLAMAEQRVVLREIAARVDLTVPDTAPERARQRNVTTIPARGGTVTVRRGSPARV